jgi:hypothetical protein
MTNPPRWRKSKFSGNQTTCVELAHTLDAVRDSKNPAGPTLRVDLDTLFAAIKDGQVG